MILPTYKATLAFVIQRKLLEFTRWMLLSDIQWRIIAARAIKQNLALFQIQSNMEQRYSRLLYSCVCWKNGGHRQIQIELLVEVELTPQALRWMDQITSKELNTLPIIHSSSCLRVEQFHSDIYTYIYEREKVGESPMDMGKNAALPGRPKLILGDRRLQSSAFCSSTQLLG